MRMRGDWRIGWDWMRGGDLTDWHGGGGVGWEDQGMAGWLDGGGRDG